MFIKKIKVQNFRQLKDIEIELQENTSILAGPNNSGKTSVILLLKRILMENNFTFKKDDFNAYDRAKWSGEFYETLKDVYANRENKNTDDLIKELINKIFPISTELEDKIDITIPKLIVNLQVDYNDEDDISNFANYIMDFEENKNSFYFIYKIILNKDLFEKAIKNNWEKIYNRLEKDTDSKKMASIMDIVLDIYCKSLVSKCYFTDEENSVSSEIQNIQEFRSLFNFKYIEAARPLDDSLEKDKKALSNALIASASKNKKWKTDISKIPDNVLNTLEDSKIKDEVERLSTKALNKTIASITQTNGDKTGKLILDLEVSENHIEDLIRNATSAKYSIEGINSESYILNETSQGLGYSNLIYMHTQIEDYIKTKDKQKVNFLVIEEPESHMHPQMQYVFSNKLLEQYDEENLQGLITTHSSEIVRGTNIEKLRVVRQETLFNSKIYNLSIFINDVEKNYPKYDYNIKDIELIKDYKSFYEVIGISEIIFADCAILFEGDTERLYLKKIVSLTDYEKLQKKYVAYIQVGNAYAYAFKDILEFLKIKSLIITDIDYDKDVKSKEEIMNSTISNATIKSFYNEDNPKISEEKVKVADLYKWIDCKNYIVAEVPKKSLDGIENTEDLMYLAFQTDKDGYTRTLEAAMISKKFNISGFEEKKRSEWRSMKEGHGLQYSIPNNRTLADKTKEKDSKFNLIEILNSTSNGKTNFMYSVILNDYAEEMLPDYIKEGLKWLMK